ncbi:MAG: Sjogren's syndrome/scleroderma autoantigen 1 family protein [Halobacteriales archaeon]
MTDDETRVMSEALTRGATMLDDACDDCGNPLFQYQGDVFCAVCRQLSSDDVEDGSTGTETDEKEAETGEDVEDGDGEVRPRDNERAEVDKHLRTLARRLARDAAESADDPDAVERRLDALERTLELLGRA